MFALFAPEIMLPAVSTARPALGVLSRGSADEALDRDEALGDGVGALSAGPPSRALVAFDRGSRTGMAERGASTYGWYGGEDLLGRSEQVPWPRSAGCSTLLGTPHL